jgi:pantetheine-phosphate adenylyltransferase
MEKHAVYAGSFDPITNGHLWVINEASQLFGKLTVVVACNPEKCSKMTFPREERVNMVKESTSNFNNVEVVSCDGQESFTVKYAHQIGAKYVIRGIRNEEDFGKEHIIRHINEDICPDVKTVFVVPPRNLSEVSSSLVKGLVGFNGWRDVLSKYVPDSVVKRFQAEHLDIDKVMIRLGSSSEQAAVAKMFIDANYTGADKFFDKLHKVDKQNSTRYYHTLAHINHCLKLLKLSGSDHMISPRVFDCIAAAIWFHDVVYVPGASDNEDKSKDAFLKFSKGLHRDDIKKVCQLIMVTKSHKPNPVRDEMWMSDIDMAILGSPEHEFKQYNDNIEYELLNYEDKTGLGEKFYRGRKNFLMGCRKNFLMGCLQSSPYTLRLFVDKFQAQMVQNITSLLREPRYRKVEL